MQTKIHRLLTVGGIRYTCGFCRDGGQFKWPAAHICFADISYGLLMHVFRYLCQDIQKLKSPVCLNGQMLWNIWG